MSILCLMFISLLPMVTMFYSFIFRVFNCLCLHDACFGLRFVIPSYLWLIDHISGLIYDMYLINILVVVHGDVISIEMSYLKIWHPLTCTATYFRCSCELRLLNILEHASQFRLGVNMSIYQYLLVVLFAAFVYILHHFVVKFKCSAYSQAKYAYWHAFIILCAYWCMGNNPQCAYWHNEIFKCAYWHAYHVTQCAYWQTVTFKCAYWHAYHVTQCAYWQIVTFKCAYHWHAILIITYAYWHAGSTIITCAYWHASASIIITSAYWHAGTSNIITRAYWHAGSIIKWAYSHPIIITCEAPRTLMLQQAEATRSLRIQQSAEATRMLRLQ